MNLDQKNTITLNAMRFFSYHGVYKEEKQNGSWYTVTLQYEADFTKAAKSDNLSDTIDYTKLYQIVKKEMAIRANLLESLAFRIAKKITQSFVIISGSITICKEKPPIDGQMKDVTITLNF